MGEIKAASNYMKAAQRKYNSKQAKKRFLRLVAANFDESAFLLHLTYQPGQEPQSEGEARRDMVNYLRRIKCCRQAEEQRTRRLMERSELQNERDGAERLAALQEQLAKLRKPLRYVYVLENIADTTPERAGWCFHLFIAGCVDLETLQKLWIKNKGRRLFIQQKDTTAIDIARSMTDNPQGSRRFCCSLAMPGRQ